MQKNVYVYALFVVDLPKTNVAYSRQKPGVGHIQDTEVAKKEINIKD